MPRNLSPPLAVSRHLRIFIVEDHPDSLKYLQMYLESIGHVVFHAGSAAEALAAIPKADCDVLISDVGLPDSDGWELLRCLKANGSAPRYSIAMSGYGSGSDVTKSREAGYRQHLLKPFVPSDLDKMLEEAAAELAGKK